MQIKLPPGFLYGAKPTSRVPPQVEMSLAVRGVFRLRPGEPVALITDLAEAAPLCGDTFADDDEERLGPLVHASDLADFKMRGEVLLKGTCWPGHGRRASEAVVAVRVGGWSKSVKVFGRRVWTAVPGNPISNPAPFVSMPLTWENAFGGNDHAANRVGRGLADGELPTVEDPRALLRSRRDRPSPATFGPVSPTWPPRAGKLGKEYGARWKKTRAPWYASDFDWSYFQAAPPDQQIKGYFAGNEELELTQLLDATPQFSARLPGMRLRAFSRLVSGVAREIPMNLDTLFIDADKGQLHLTWRGLTPVNDDDLADVRTVLVATEPLADRPLSVTFYAAALDAFEAKPVDPTAHVPPEVLARKAELLAQAQAMKPPPAGPDLGAHPVDMASQAAGAAMGGLEPEQRAQAGEAFARMKEGYDAGAARFATVAEKAGPPAPTTDPFQASLDQLTRARASAVARGVPTEKLDAAMAETAKAREAHAQAEAQMAAAARAVPPGGPSVEVPTLAATLASAAPSAPGGAPRIPSPPRAEPGPGADLMERDLSGQDFRGKSLERALLRRAKLHGANLARVNLSRADLGGADLSDADLSGADLTSTNFSGANLRGAKLDGARLTQTLFAGAELTSATLNEAAASMASFQKASLEGCVAQRARFFKCIGPGAKLDGADFTLSDLSSSVFMEASAKKAIFSGCTLDKVGFLACDLTEAVFAEAHGGETSFQRSTLDGASFHYARLPGAHFTEASLRGAQLYGAYLVRARFYRAVLEGAAIVRSDLRSVDARKAVLGRTKLTGSNLYDAKLLGVVGTAECDFFEANMKAVQWEPT